MNCKCSGSYLFSQVFLYKTLGILHRCPVLSESILPAYELSTKIACDYLLKMLLSSIVFGLDNIKHVLTH